MLLLGEPHQQRMLGAARHAPRGEEIDDRDLTAERGARQARRAVEPGQPNAGAGLSIIADGNVQRIAPRSKRQREIADEHGEERDRRGDRAGGACGAQQLK